MSGRSTHPGVVVGVDGSSSTMAVRWTAGEPTMHNVPPTVMHVSSLGSVSTAALHAARIPVIVARQH